jgi:hypothetical protein
VLAEACHPVITPDPQAPRGANLEVQPRHTLSSTFLPLLLPGPFEFRGVSHLFYQYAPPGSGPGPGVGGHKIWWGHVAGNLSHWHCLPPAISPGVDYDGRHTSYDSVGIFTGSVTVVNGSNGVPVARNATAPTDVAKCAKQMRTTIQANQMAPNSTWKMCYNQGLKGKEQPSVPAFESAVAAFLVQRGASALFDLSYDELQNLASQYNWSPWLEADAGIPLGIAVETGTNVFVRKWSNAVVTYDCNKGRGRVALKTTDDTTLRDAPPPPVSHYHRFRRRRRRMQPGKGPGNETCANPGPRPSGDTSHTDRWAKKFHIFDWSCGTNDPNAPVWDPVHKLYHVFYQRHIWEGSGKQHETARGPVWGHVASADLVHWARLPTALWNDEWYDDVAVCTSFLLQSRCNIHT